MTKLGGGLSFNTERNVMEHIELDYDFDKQCHSLTTHYADGGIHRRPVRDDEDLAAIKKRIDYQERYGTLKSLSPRQELILEIESYPTDSMEEQDFLDSIVFNLRSG